MNLMITTNQKPIIKRQKNKEEGIELTLKKTIKPQGKIIREDERSKEVQKQPETINKVVISTYLLIITLNVNGLNSPIKRHRMTEWI